MKRDYKKGNVMQNVKIYTDGINRVAGTKKGDLPKSFFVLTTLEIEDKKDLAEIEEYGSAILKYYENNRDANSESYIFFSKFLHIGCLNVEANKEKYNYQIRFKR